MNTTALILPGIGNSGPQHWQTLWQQAQSGFVRVEQADWDYPVCADWVNALELAVQRAGPGVVLVAHSLACLVVAHWAAQSHASIKGALLVALPDPQGPTFPPEALGFAKTPTLPFDFPSTLVVSADDPARPNIRRAWRALGKVVASKWALAATSTRQATLATGPKVWPCTNNCAAPTRDIHFLQVSLASSPCHGG